MTFNLGPCSFHKDNPAISSCTRCHRFLCSEDRKIFMPEMTELDYCPICYVSAVKSKRNSILILSLGMTIFIIIPFLIFTGASSNDYVYKGIILLGCLGFILFFLLLSLNISVGYSKAQKEADEFLNSLNNKSVLFTSIKGTHEPQDFDQEARLTIKNPKHLVCFQCGGGLLITDKFCPNCGDSTKDELRAIES